MTTPVKGVLSPEDATSAVKAGADGIVVSNHGGRQLDGLASSISALPGISESVGGKTEILMDGRARSGLDVFRALALGATGVMTGRPLGLCRRARLRGGVTDLLGANERELRVAMALCGESNLPDITREMVLLSDVRI